MNFDIDKLENVIKFDKYNFKDILGRRIQIGDVVTFVYSVRDTYKILKTSVVIGFTDKSLRIVNLNDTVDKSYTSCVCDNKFIIINEEVKTNKIMFEQAEAIRKQIKTMSSKKKLITRYLMLFKYIDTPDYNDNPIFEENDFDTTNTECINGIKKSGYFITLEFMYDNTKKSIKKFVQTIPNIISNLNEYFIYTENKKQKKWINLTDFINNENTPVLFSSVTGWAVPAIHYTIDNYSEEIGLPTKEQIKEDAIHFNPNYDELFSIYKRYVYRSSKSAYAVWNIRRSGYYSAAVTKIMYEFSCTTYNFFKGEN